MVPWVVTLSQHGTTTLPQSSTTVHVATKLAAAIDTSVRKVGTAVMMMMVVVTVVMLPLAHHSDRRHHHHHRLCDPKNNTGHVGPLKPGVATELRDGTNLLSRSKRLMIVL